MNNYENKTQELQQSVDVQVDNVLDMLRKIADNLDIDIDSVDSDDYTTDYNDTDNGEYYEAPFIINNPIIL